MATAEFEPSMIQRVRDFAYCAGVIDSDGTIGIKRNTYSVRVVGDSRQPTYSERVCVRQVTPEAVTLLQQLFGGSLGPRKAQTENGRPLWEWCTTDRNAALCLAALGAFLRIKREQAANCLALRDLKERSRKQRMAVGRGHAGGAPRSPELSAQMEALYQRAKELNRVGV